MRLLNESGTRILALAATVLLCSAGFAGAQDSAEVEEELLEELDELAPDGDKTGTNPINFQREIRFYNEYSWLTSAGGGNQNVTTAEFRSPLLDGRFQFRSRIRYSKLKADFNNDGANDIDDNGWGDIDFRFLTVPVLMMERAQAVAFGFEVFLDTASENALGAGTTSLGPQVFFVQFFKRGLFAPGLQYKFSVDEDDNRGNTEQFIIDLNFLLMAKDKQSWFFTDPQIIFDRETQDNYAIIDFEFGVMMTKFFEKLKGQSFYLRPSVGVGDGRPWDASIEVGYKIVGW